MNKEKSKNHQVELWDLYSKKRAEKSSLEDISGKLSMLFDDQETNKKGNASKFWQQISQKVDAVTDLKQNKQPLNDHS